MDRLLYRLTAGMPARLIKLNGRPYLERYYVGQLFGVTFYLHRFVSSDSERHLHNHPWTWGRALVLAGSYNEQRVTDLSPAAAGGCLTDFRHVRFWNRVDGNHFHRIAWVRPGTWTLFFHGPRARIVSAVPDCPLKGWGFLERDLRDGEWVTVFEPFKSTASGWWRTAPNGRDVGRVPL